MKLETRITRLQSQIEERVAALVLAYGKDTARKIVIKAHNTAKDDNDKLKCQVALRILANA